MSTTFIIITREIQIITGLQGLGVSLPYYISGDNE